MVTIVKDEPLIEHILEYDCILFGMSNNNAMNIGFLYELNLNFKDLVKSENNTGYCDLRKFGTVHCTEIDGKKFCACYVLKRNFDRKLHIIYDYLENSLNIIKNNFSGMKIVSPIIGCEYGDKDEIIKIYEDIFTDCDITLYDYEQRNVQLDLYKERCNLYRQKTEGKITPEEFKEKYNKLYWISKNGILNEMPENFEAPKKFSFKNKV